MEFVDRGLDHRVQFERRIPLIFMNSLEKCFVMGIPSSEKGDFWCRVLNNVEKAQECEI